MKNKYILIFILSAFILSACEDQLNVSPSTSLSSDDGVITSIDRAELAVNGMYDELQDGDYYGNYVLVFGDLASDNMSHTGTQIVNNQVSINEILPDNSRIATIWDDIYEVINIANTIIADVPQIENADETDANRLMGEAYFVRALSYFSLVKNWAGVPLVTSPTRDLSNIELLSRSSQEEVYNQVESDFNQAITLLGTFDVNGRANAWAARGLLARAHLYQGEWQDAYDLANDVISNSGYSLAGTYAEIFDYAAPFSSESMFEISFSSQDGNSLAFWNYIDEFGGRYEYGPTTAIVNAYTDPNDSRFDVNIANQLGTYVVNKFTDVAAGSDNVMVIRLSEMYFIRAEALINGATGTAVALDDLNTVRIRSGAAPLAGPVTTDLILAERNLEFAFEGHRWYDLTRTNKAIDVIGTVTSVNQYLWPIPQDERDVNNNLTQNTGY